MASACRFSIIGQSAVIIGNEKRRRVYECYWAHFAAEIHLSE